MELKNIPHTKYNLLRLGFTQTYTNSYETTRNNVNIRVTFLFNQVTLRVSLTKQSVRDTAKVVKALWGLDFHYKIRVGLLGTDLSFRVTLEGLRGFLRILEALQKILK